MGQLQLLVQGKSNGDNGAVAAIVRKLRLCPAQKGNELVVEKYIIRRYEYELTSSLEFELDVIPLSHILHRTILVPDMLALTKAHGVDCRLSYKQKSAQDRTRARFFAIPVKVTSFVEEPV